MNKTPLTLILIATILAAAPLRAGVKVSPPESTDTAPAVAATPAGPVEKRVAFITAEKKYLTANTGGVLDLSGVKIGSKQSFTLIDLNGGELADGDEVKIQYIPNSAGVPNPSKATYWRVGKEGIIRKREGDTFKIRKIDGKYAFQTQGGKFVTGTVTDGALSLSDKQEEALLVELVDVQPRAAK